MRKARRSMAGRRFSRREVMRWGDTQSVYLTLLSRYPTEQESKLAAGNPDLPWALLNSAEFLYRH